MAALRALSRVSMRAPRLSRHMASIGGAAPNPFPTVESVKKMPRLISDLSNDSVFELAEEGNKDALRERVRREIMAVDEMEYAATTARIQEMSQLVSASHTLYTSPYHIGIWSAQIGGYASLPLVFSYTAASKFNDLFVTADPPDVRRYFSDTFVCLFLRSAPRDCTRFFIHQTRHPTPLRAGG